MVQESIQEGPGLTRTEWNKVLDRYLTEKTMEADQYATMNEAQRRVIQELKKSFSRINNKEK